MEEGGWRMEDGGRQKEEEHCALSPARCALQMAGHPVIVPYIYKLRGFLGADLLG
jgi:hypothetical protein